MKRLSVPNLLIFLCLFVGISLQLNAQEGWPQVDGVSNFIAIGVHGYPAKAVDTHGGFENASTFSIPETYGEEKANIFAYDLSEHSKVNSETYVQEVGDFNNGSRRLNYEHPQCHISLAKSEWIYRHSEYLIDNCINPVYLNKNIINLLKSDLRFIDLFVSWEHIKTKITPVSSQLKNDNNVLLGLSPNLKENETRYVLLNCISSCVYSRDY